MRATKETQAMDKAIAEAIAMTGDRDIRSIYTFGNKAIIVADPATLTIWYHITTITKSSRLRSMLVLYRYKQ